MPKSSRKSIAKSPWQASIVYRKLSDLRPHEHNPKTHSDKQVRALARSQSAHGFVNPILIDADGVIIAGHGRYQAANCLALEMVPTIELGHLTPAQQKAYRIADNKLAEGSEWSIEMLNLEVDAILELDADFDLSLTGFDARDLKIGLDVAEAEAGGEEPDVPELPKSAVSRLGDLWIIGEHALLCGDALVSGNLSAPMGRDLATMVFGDPPYRVPIQGHVSGNGRVKHRDFVMGCGEMSDADFRDVLAELHEAVCQVLEAMARSITSALTGATWRICSQRAPSPTRSYKNLCVWTKSNGGMGSLYRSQHELIAVFKHGTAAHINNVELGKNGRNRSNVWAYAGMNSFSKERDEALQLHPTVKPLALVRDAIFDASMRDDIVLDPFGGSGTTLLAADAARRRARLIELDPRYCDVIVTRAQQTLGVEALLAGTEKTFAVVAAQRRDER